MSLYFGLRLVVRHCAELPVDGGEPGEVEVESDRWLRLCLAAIAVAEIAFLACGAIAGP